ISNDKIENDVSFYDYGLDSILSASFIKNVNDSLEINLETSILFEYSNVISLSQYVINNYKDQITNIKVQSPYESDLKAAKLKVENEDSKVLNLRKSKFHSRASQPSSYIRTNTSLSTEIPEIAVIGMSGQFPKANDINTFWKNLISGVDSVSELPLHILNQERYFYPDKQQGKTYCKWGGFLETREYFDPLFFNLSPREAESMNIHQRLVLQEGWKALEDSGCNPKDLANSKTGVFIGAEPTGYFHESFTGASEAIIASRLAYYLNLKGPAFVVNTGCSSSGVALHLACESLRNGESTVAIAGGVCATLGPEMLIALSQIEMLSPTGKCNTFDSSADGTIFSEGIGIVILKRVQDAIKDQDPIYGVICGSGINQDGASNGITAPNGVAQEQLIKDVYEKYQINPNGISYVEAHGTGTKLGDPVEANALVRAFKNFTKKKNYCAIGSAKAHIGHTAAGAGVIGLIKVLLSMQHQQIPQLLNFKKINSSIELKDSPFFINTQVSEWKSKGDTPRMAALNSFGHSGTNAHLVIKEYIPSQFIQSAVGINSEKLSALIPFSAKTEESLEASIKKFLFFLNEQESILLDKKITLENIAHTLQTGREPMKYRVAFLAENISEIKEQLDSFLKKKKDIENYWIGKVESDQFFLLSSDEDAKEMLNRWIEKNKLKKIGELWCQGFSIEWDLLYGDNKPRRIHLPTYSFAKERYWISKEKRFEKSNQGPEYLQLNPLLHRNTSTLEEERFTSTFTGHEFFLSDRQVKGEKVFPGVGYLEMARAAVEKASGETEEGTTIYLKNVVWIQPIVFNSSAQEVNIGLFGEGSGLIQYEVYTGSANEEGTVVHSRGVAEFKEKEEALPLDVQELQSQMNQRSLSAEDCYQVFKGMGREYGEGYRGIRELYQGENQVLARLSLPSSLKDTQSEYVLHPSLMDAALQSSIVLMLKNMTLPDGSEASLNPSLPFALESLEILASCASQVYAWVRHSGGSATSDKVKKLDIDLCDEQGIVCVRMRRLDVSSSIKYAIDPSITTLIPETTETSLNGIAYLPEWEESSFKTEKFTSVHKVVLVVCHEDSLQFEEKIRHYYERSKTSKVIVIRLADQTRQLSEHEWFCDIHDKAGFETCLEKMDNIDCLYFLSMDQKRLDPVSMKELIDSQENNEIQLLRLVKCLKKSKKISSTIDSYFLTLNNYSIHHQPTQPKGAGIHGLAYSLAQGNHQFCVRNIDLSSEDLRSSQSQTDTLSIIVNEPASNRGEAIKLQSGKRYRQTFYKLNWDDTTLSGIRQEGVYLIVGGSGTVGQVITRNLIKKYQATVIWIGRSSGDSEKIETTRNKFREYGEKVVYVQADVTDLESLKQAVQSLKERYSRIHGAIFSGLVFNPENSIEETTDTEFRDVLDVKTRGSLNFYTVLAKESLDFICYFSSIQSFYFTSASKSCGYATGTTFADVVAKSLENKSQFPIGIINWGYWESSISGTFLEKSLENRFGLVSDQEGFEC
ncbi:MAG: SDR family NAD(P)-dependent oxidoreductase, partial [Planctomycetes bacterium]|nr:SDR family NAD(P)-dependent oxidoreductase [Planctomycetota bacterium]